MKTYYDKDTNPSLIKNKKVAIFGVHFEGNLGDLMETTPLVERLHEWGVEIDCYLSMFRGGLGRSGGPVAKDSCSPSITSSWQGQSQWLLLTFF